MSYLHNFLFGIYPYVALTIFLLGSLIRFDREQYSWKSDSSQLLRRAQLRLGSNLFHIGILFLFFGHLAGLLTPHWLYESFGLSTPNKQMLAIISGGLAGSLCFAGVAILLHRRLTEPRIRATSKPMDIFIMLWILATLLLGLVSILFSLHHSEGGVMLLLAGWAQHIVTFRGGAADFLVGVPIIYKIHLLFGMTLFVLFPFSRLVHVWSGFASVTYAARPWQLVRPRG
jgi:nitrate reductase gamma subunit